MGTKTSCDNPMCSCTPCTCDSCSCGVATLGDLERRVMDILWEDPGRELTVRSVADVLPEYAYTTVATVLERLGQKGLVRRRKVRGVVWFVAIGTRGAHTAVLMREALAVSSDPDAALIRFSETLSDEEATVLRRALDRAGPQSSGV
jgi:predicted transcriptional regulator